jgi:hypothetical protein
VEDGFVRNEKPCFLVYFDKNTVLKAGARQNITAWNNRIGQRFYGWLRIFVMKNRDSWGH